MATANNLNLNPGVAGNVIVSQGAAAPPIGVNSGTVSGCVLLNTYTASNSATIDMTSQISATYYAYTIVGTNITFGTGSNFLAMRFSSNNGSTWDSTVGNYGYCAPSQLLNGAGTITAASSTSSGAGIIMGTLDANKNVSFTLDLIDPGTAGVKFFAKGVGYRGGAPIQIVSTSIYNVASSINAVRIFMSASNTDTGTFQLYGWLA